MTRHALRPADLGHAPLLLSEELAAAEVGLSVSTIRTLEGFPSPRRVGRRKLYRYADLAAWAASLPSDDEAEMEDERRQAMKAFGG